MPAGPPGPAGPSNGSFILEEPLIRTPYELLRRAHRSAQRQVERDFTVVQSGLNGLLKSLKAESSGDGKENALAKLDQAAERVRGLKRKLDDLQPGTAGPSSMRSRLTYFDELQAAAGKRSDGEYNRLAPPETEAGADKTLDRYIVDYLLRTGRMKAATALTEKRGIEDLVDTKLFTELVRIENALIEKHSVVEALAWCGENRGTLKKTKNNLEFTLRLQEFIELCRKRDLSGAIAYSRKNLASWAPTHMAKLQQAMTLLAFGERTNVGVYHSLYEPKQWETVAYYFRETFLGLYGLPRQPLLSLALSAGLSCLRLPSCVPYETPFATHDSPKSPVFPLLPAAPPLHNLEETLSAVAGEIEHLTAPVGGVHTSLKEDLHEHPEALVGNVDCPTCAEDMRVLAHEVPMSHHVNSTIVCRISGEVMDSQNEPLAFPNGYVYSSKALKAMADKMDDVVTCPRTREHCTMDQLRKVYIS